VIVNAVPPGIPPPVAFEQDLEQSSGIDCTGRADWPAVHDQRQFAVVRNKPVLGETKDVRLALPQGGIDLTSGWPSPSGNLLDLFLECFEERHHIVLIAPGTSMLPDPAQFQCYSAAERAASCPSSMIIPPDCRALAWRAP